MFHYVQFLYFLFFWSQRTLCGGGMYLRTNVSACTSVCVCLHVCVCVRIVSVYVSNMCVCVCSLSVFFV